MSGNGWVVRSRRAELHNGGTDGKYKKLVPDSSDSYGLNTAETQRARQHLNWDWHGVAGAPGDAAAPADCSCCGKG